MNFGPYPAVVRDIHDGDTVGLDVDLGFGFYLLSHDLAGKPMTSCRIYGINAPELATPAGKAALAYVQTILRLGDQVTVLSHGWDKYGGRFDGTVTLADGRDLAKEMLDAGHALPYFGTGPKQ